MFLSSSLYLFHILRSPHIFLLWIYCLSSFSYLFNPILIWLYPPGWLSPSPDCLARMESKTLTDPGTTPDCSAKFSCSIIIVVVILSYVTGHKICSFYRKQQICLTKFENVCEYQEHLSVTQTSFHFHKFPKIWLIGMCVSNNR